VQNQDYEFLLVYEEKFDSGWKNHGIAFDPELLSCKGSACPKWKEWEGRCGCIHLIKAGKYGRK
jgi:hypothetical protein